MDIELNLRSDNQSEMQFGFTPGLSPNMAALIVSEVCAETSARKPLFITTLDSQKAFDVVNRKILLDKLYNLGMELEIWNLIYKMHDGLSATVKWQGRKSGSFSVEQGVRQGGVLSTHLYKVYINELLLDLERHDLGISIGNAYPSCPSCADDIVLLASNQIELQEMLHVVDGYSKDH